MRRISIHYVNDEGHPVMVEYRLDDSGVVALLALLDEEGEPC
jgi:hypothetical protein